MRLRNGKEIKNGSEPYIVAELNSSHNGNVDIAKKMIDTAKECGCNAVKLQSWTPDSLYCKDYYDNNPISKRMVSKFSLSSQELSELADHCNKSDIDFTSTPYSNDEVDFIVDKCSAPYIKIASMDIDNIPFLKYIAGKKVPIVLSTGMSTIEEIDRAVGTIEGEGNKDICILHCVSLYPVNPTAVNLKNMLMLSDRFPQYTVGYSDHTIGSEVACAAVALGAAMIEKHFTLDNQKIGWDNQMATEPTEMKRMVEGCRNVYYALGSYDRKLSDNELNQKEKMRRSIVAAVDMEEGHCIGVNDITAKRPGDGIPIGKWENIIGCTIKDGIKKDQMIRKDHLKELK